MQKVINGLAYLILQRDYKEEGVVLYALIETGGKQYKVEEGQELRVELLAADANEEVTFDRVLMVKNGDDLTVGKPFVEGAKVTAKVLEHGKGPKMVVYKYKPKKNYRRKQGHRQPYTKISIQAIEV